jgi:hypothetical protein
VFQDGFGTRWVARDAGSGEPIEVLAFAPALAAHPGFATAVGERVARLARVRHAHYARVRRLERPSPDVLHLHSDLVPGWRLADVLAVTERQNWRVDVGAVVALLRQLIAAAALFSRHQRDAVIGTIGPERLILTPQGRVVIAEYAFAPGLEALQMTRERLWRNLRVGVPPGTVPGRLQPSADVVGIGLVALALLIGRPLREEEFLVSLGDLVDAATETSGGTVRALSAGFKTWIGRALHFDEATAFGSVQDAQVGFEALLAAERAYVTTPTQLELLIAKIETVAGPPETAPAPASGITPTASTRGARESASSDAETHRSSGGPGVGGTLPAVEPTAGSTAGATAPLAGSAVSSARSVESPRALSSPPQAAVAEVATAARVDPQPVQAAPRSVSPTAAAREPVVALPPTRPLESSPSAAEVGSTSSAAGVWLRRACVALAVLAVAEAGVIAWLASASPPAASAVGELVIQSRPAAARVSIDGDEKGVTPVSVELSPGPHVVEVRVGRSEPRVVPVMIRPGVQSGLYLELQSVETVGALEIRTGSTRADVMIGGVHRGQTPLLVNDLPPGPVEVVVRAGTREVRQTVRIEPGITSQLVVPWTP